MIFIEIWGLGLPENERMLQDLRDEVIVISQTFSATLSGNQVLNIPKEEISVLFPPNRMKKGLGEEIFIRVKGLGEDLSWGNKIYDYLAKNLGLAVRKHFPNARVECFVETFNLAQGF